MKKINDINQKLLVQQYGDEISIPETEMISDKIMRKYESIFKRFKLMKRPVIVPVRTKGKTGMGILGQCHSNVTELVERIGGKAIRGYWLQRKKNGTMTAFIWHSIWETPEGKWVDVTASSTKNYETCKELDFIPVATINPLEEDCYFIEDFIVHDDRHEGLAVRSDFYGDGQKNMYVEKPFNWLKSIVVTISGNIDNVSYSKSIIHKDYLEQFGLNVFNLTEKCRNDNLSLSYSGGTQ
tara:strand:- start:3 stop:719 length:717 start_codon:yes stop_codon:yes gene_type:complete